MSRFVIFVFLASILPSFAFALGNVPTCTKAGFDWTFNSHGKSPCTVASALAEGCTHANFTIPALDSTQSYSGPDPEDETQCRCSTVFYSMLSACALCQGANISTWSSYDQNCSTVLVSVYPEFIEATFAVPAYAYLDVTEDDSFNPKLAQGVTGPDSTGLPVPSPSDSSSIPSSTTHTSSSTHHSITHTSSSSKAHRPTKSISSQDPARKTDALVIALIAIGGLTTLTTSVVIGLFVVRRRRRSRLALTEQYTSAYTDGTR